MDITETKKQTLNNLSKELCVKRNFFLVDLRKYFNNDGVSYDDLKCDGDFDGKGSTFPAEEMPPSNSLFYLDGVPFYFPSKEKGYGNNITLSGQSISIGPGKYKKLYVLGAVDGQNGEVYEEEVTVSLSDGTFQPIYLGMSNWLLSPKYKERAAFKCSHLHYPEIGQEIIATNQMVPTVDSYKEFEGNYLLSEPISEEIDIEEAKKGIWRPRVWFQQVALNFNVPIIGLTFMDNINFHIFSLTLEREGNNL